MKQVSIFVILLLHICLASAQEVALEFSELPLEKFEKLLSSNEFNNSILKETRYFKLDEDRDLLSVDTISKVFHGLWLANYKENRYTKISFNIPQHGPYTEGETLMFVAAGSDLRHGEGYDSVSIISFQGEVTEKQLFTGSYIYQEMERASCSNGENTLQGLAKEKIDFSVSKATPIKITISFYERDCNTNNVKEVSESYDINGNKI